MGEINKMIFGRTGHSSTRAIFGSVCLKQVSQNEADRILDLLLNYGINHIDTAPLYGDAEIRIGAWMRHYREHFFLATKINKRTKHEAREQFYRSLDRLQVDRVDLLQLHNLTDVVEREYIMAPMGALEFLVEAKEEGLARFIGITGHGIEAPKMHRLSLERFEFDTVLLPCNYLLMQNQYYFTEFNALISYCRKHKIAIQTIKSIARGYWGSKHRSHVTWYEPLHDEEAITKSVHWVLGIPNIFLITVGDIQELSKVLSAAASFHLPPLDKEMLNLVKNLNFEPIFI